MMVTEFRFIQEEGTTTKPRILQYRQSFTSGAFDLTPPTTTPWFTVKTVFNTDEYQEAERQVSERNNDD